MDSSEQTRFDALYAKHLRALKLQGKAAKTIDGYARALRRVTAHFDRCPDRLDAEDFKSYFASLIDKRSWSLVKIERCGLQFFYEHVLEREWPWVDMLKPPVVHALPDVLSVDEVAQIIRASRERRYRTFWLTTYSLGLRLGETLRLRIGDIDSARAQVHIRGSKGHKDRFVVLPALTLQCLRRYWRDHRHHELLFPGRAGPQGAAPVTSMDRGSTQKAFARVVADCGIRTVTFRYRDAKTLQPALRTLPVAEFLWRMLAHVLPTGFRRVREYGFLHCRAKRRLVLVQLVLHVLVQAATLRPRPPLCCMRCHTPMIVVAVTKRRQPDG